MAIVDGQIVVTMISREPSVTIVKSQLEAIAALPRPSSAIFDGQVVVVMSLRGPSMALDESQFRVIVTLFGP